MTRDTPVDVLDPFGQSVRGVVELVFPRLVAVRCPDGFLRSVPRDGAPSPVNGWRLARPG